MNEQLVKPTVLIANDQEWSGRSLESIFAAEGYGVIRAFTGAQAIQKAEESSPDVIILDRQMPDLDGAEVCRRLRADARIGVRTPILITTAGQAGRTQRLEAFKAGAWDFFGQPIDGEAILCKVRTFLEATRFPAGSADIVDPVTGLYTRLGLDRRAREISSAARRNHQPITCVVFSPESPGIEGAVDHLQDLARGVAEFFRESGRTADAVGQLGPCEFGLIAPSTSPEGAARLLERLEAAVTRNAPPEVAPVTVRAGYFTVSDLAETPIRAEEMLDRASSAMKVPTPSA